MKKKHGWKHNLNVNLNIEKKFQTKAFVRQKKGGGEHVSEITLRNQHTFSGSIPNEKRKYYNHTFYQWTREKLVGIVYPDILMQEIFIRFDSARWLPRRSLHNPLAIFTVVQQM